MKLQKEDQNRTQMECLNHMHKCKFVTLTPTTHSEETDTPSLSLPLSDALSHEQLRYLAKLGSQKPCSSQGNSSFTNLTLQQALQLSTD